MPAVSKSQAKLGTKPNLEPSINASSNPLVLVAMSNGGGQKYILCKLLVFLSRLENEEFNGGVKRRKNKAIILLMFFLRRC